MTLTKIDDTMAMEPLCAALHDRNETVRYYAAKTLEKIGDIRAVGSLCEALDDKNGGVRQSAAEALGRIGDIQAVEPLCILLDDKDDNVRQTAAKSLKTIGVPDEPQIKAKLAVITRDWDNAERIRDIRNRIYFPKPPAADPHVRQQRKEAGDGPTSFLTLLPFPFSLCLYPFPFPCLP